jgi:hypothetical protein
MTPVWKDARRDENDAVFRCEPELMLWICTRPHATETRQDFVKANLPYNVPAIFHRCSEIVMTTTFCPPMKPPVSFLPCEEECDLSEGK